MHLRDRSKLKRADGTMPPQHDGPRLAEMMTTGRVCPTKSVKRILGDMALFDSGSTSRKTPIPMRNPIFRLESKELKQLRKAEAWKKGTREDQLVEMARWFPDVPRLESPMEPSAVEMQDVESPAAPFRPRPRELDCPTSDIGRLVKLPGELRNRIYRLAMLQPPKEGTDQLATFEMEPGTCSQGACLHSKLSYNVPGIANTCRQLRWEAMPIFCVENEGFQFGDNMVHQCCVGNLLRSIGDYADSVPQFQFLLKRPIWDHDKFVDWAFYNFILTPPKRPDDEDALSAATSDGWTLVQHEQEGRQVCQCALDEYVRKMNERGGEMSSGKEVIDFAESDEFADFVWRMRKSKQWPQFLKRCKMCKKVFFNN